MNRIISRIFFAFFVATLLSSTALAQEMLNITTVDTEKAPVLSVYFGLMGSDGLPISGLQVDNCKLKIDKKPRAFKTFELKPFREGNVDIAIYFLFPIAKNYAEDEFAIRSNVQNVMQAIRPQDWIGVLAYDRAAKLLGVKREGGVAALRRAVNDLTNTTVIEPNLFAALSASLNATRALEGVAKKYLIVISDAEGAGYEKTQNMNRNIQKFVEAAKAAGVVPIFIAYSIDGIEVMPNRGVLRKMAINGAYFEAGSTGELSSSLEKAQSFIYTQYILEAELDLDEGEWLEEGLYPVELNVKTSEGEFNAETRMNWPKLSKNLAWLWWTIGGSLAFIGLIILIIILRRRAGNEEVEYVPQEIICQTCGKTVPSALYAYNGEFCLSGGVPDCPYYRMPDQGKVQITRGPMADTTFFIKQEITTIGSNIENNIYLSDKSVSRKHAAIKMDEARRYELRDFGSANGTYINGDRCERKFLRDGDILRFGGVETVFKLK